MRRGSIAESIFATYACVHIGLNSSKIISQPNPKLKELLKSVHICQSYRKNKSGTFLLPTVYYYLLCYHGSDISSSVVIFLLFCHCYCAYCALCFCFADMF